MTVVLVVMAAALGAAPDASAPSAVVEAAWGKGLGVKAGDFSLTLRGRVQVRATANGPGPGATGPRVNEFLIRRARLAIAAQYTDAWRLNVQLAFATLDMEPDAPNVLRDAYITWQAFRDVQVRAGQMKVPFGRQRVVSSSSLQMVDRSIVVAELNLDRDVGVLVRSEDLFGLGGRLAYAVGVMGGDGRNRLGTNVGLLSVARVQVSPFGGFDDLVEGDLSQGATPRLAIGLAAAHNVQTIRPRSTTGTPLRNGTLTYSHLAADAVLKWRGLSVMGEALYRDGRADELPGPTRTEWGRSAWGYVLQAGFMVGPEIEASARWGQLRPLADTDPTLQHQRELGVGFGWYPKKHDLKWQADAFWLPTGPRFEVGTWQVRTQLQLYF